MIGILSRRTRSGSRPLLVGAIAAALAIAGVTALSLRPAAALTGDALTHDPSVIKVGSCYYAFATGAAGYGGGTISVRRSCSTTGYSGWTTRGTIWSKPPAWIAGRLGQTPPNLWAPDINYFNGRYYLYYAASIWGKTAAVTGLATATDINGPWTDAGEVTNVNYPIDPNIGWVGHTPYIMWGSFKGIYLHLLNATTGKLGGGGLTRIATGIEGSSLSWNGGYFYLWGSKGTCCRGVNSTYYTVVGRSKTIEGPYLDQRGVDMNNGGGTRILSGSGSQVAAGGGDVFTDGSATRFAYHFYDANNNGAGTLNIRTITYANGWPALSAPLAR